MTTYLITHRSEDSQLIHREGSAEEAACEIANQLLMFYGSAEKLMAIKSDSPLATFSLIKDDVLCSIDVTKLGAMMCPRYGRQSISFMLLKTEPNLY